MQNLLQNLKSHIIQLCENPEFIHHKWYVKYHLNYVEQISFELCEIYPDADKDTVFALVWMHDYGKIISYNHQYDKYQE
jgi:23S rRNA maturation-related 3'-5' exoribonuclease YhaM